MRNSEGVQIGCAALTYYVQCARHVVTAKPSVGEPDYGEFSEPERACEAAQAEASGAAGAPNESQAGAANAAIGGAPGAATGGTGGVPDACETFVDPPEAYFDDQGVCIAVQDTNLVGTCIIDGECCVILDPYYCGV